MLHIIELAAPPQWQGTHLPRIGRRDIKPTLLACLPDTKTQKEEEAEASAVAAQQVAGFIMPLHQQHGQQPQQHDGAGAGQAAADEMGLDLAVGGGEWPWAVEFWAEGGDLMEL